MATVSPHLENTVESGRANSNANANANATDHAPPAELAWLLRDYLPPSVADIGDSIHDALLVSTSRVTGPKMTSTLAVSSLSSDTVKGFVTIDGFNIVKGDIALKLPHYNRSSAVKVTISPNKPYKLHQLQNVRNHLLAAHDAFSTLDSSAYDAESLTMALKKILKESTAAMRCLKAAADSTVFPLKECDVKAFAPELPEDLIVEFYIEDSRLITSVYSLVLEPSSVVAIPLQQLQTRILSKFRTTKADTYKGRPVQVLDELTVESPFPVLEKIAESVTHASQQCSSILNLLRESK
ncbi:RAVE subunit 2/Rogdi [Zopfochytrium polystomum]|nr:RAVE subunit 2/Rogdi [Zopfochytrium polystomum]